MDLPAPVSPVRTLKPASKRMSADSIRAIFSICSKESMVLPHFLPDSGSLQKLVDLLDELLSQIVVPHDQDAHVIPRQTGHHARYVHIVQG